MFEYIYIYINYSEKCKRKKQSFIVQFRVEVDNHS